MNFYPDQSIVAHPAVGITVLALIVAEGIWSWARKAQRHGAKDTLINLAIFAGRTLLGGASAALVLRALGGVYAHRLLTVPVGMVGAVLGFFVVDFLYYVEHRMLHTVPALWFLHRIHHSSTYLNFTTSFRLHWLGPVLTPVFFAPAALLGFPPEMILGFHAVNLLFQFLLHTELVGRVPWVEGLLDTPSAHRVHHASNPQYVDRNFGGILMIWDRLFGTYTPETERPVYGLAEKQKTARLLQVPAGLRSAPQKTSMASGV